MTRLIGDWRVARETLALFEAIEREGDRLYFVGGCVRDALIGRPVKDVDFATTAAPDAVIARVEAAGMRAVPTGIEHGTVTVISDGVVHEVTTFRRDVSTDGRRATVAATGDIDEDAARRDFTMNALYADGAGELIDPTGRGLDDLRQGYVRFVGDPAARIAEDYLRILRYFRFLAWYGDAGAGVDRAAIDAVARGRDGLAQLSRERVGAEVMRLLEAPDPAQAVALMAQTGVLAEVLPGAVPAALAVLVDLEAALERPLQPIRRLAALTGGIEAAEVADRLRLSRAEQRQLARLADALGADRPPAEVAYRDGLAAGEDVLILRASVTGQTPGQAAFAHLARAAEAEFPLSAADLMPGLAGPALGAALKRLEARWIASDFRMDRAALLREL